MNPARLMLLGLLPLLALNVALWAWYAHEPLMAAFWPLLGAFAAWATDWSEPRSGVGQ